MEDKEWTEEENKSWSRASCGSIWSGPRGKKCRGGEKEREDAEHVELSEKFPLKIGRDKRGWWKGAGYIQQ